MFVGYHKEIKTNFFDVGLVRSVLYSVLQFGYLLVKFEGSRDGRFSRT